MLDHQSSNNANVIITNYISWLHIEKRKYMTGYITAKELQLEIKVCIDLIINDIARYMGYLIRDINKKSS